MSSRHDDHLDDAEFEAFLKGDGELASMLRQMPRAEPSPELDARILADAEAALAQRTPANDPAIPEAGQSPYLAPSTMSRFLRRARVPLGLAATLVIGVSLGLQWFEQPEAVHEAVVPVNIPSDREAPPAAYVPPPADTPPPPPAKMAAPAEARMAAKPSSKIIEEVKPPPLPELAVAKRAETATSARQISPIAPPKMVEPPWPVIAPPEVQVATPPPQNTIAAVSNVKPENPVFAPPQARAPSSFATANVPTQAVAAAPAYLPLPNPVAKAPAPADDARDIAGKAGDKAEEKINDTAGEKAKAWLDRIDSLITQQKKEEALRSWEDFRKAYPNYPIPEPLKARIKALTSP